MNRNDVEHFWENVKRGNSDECWVWVGSKVAALQPYGWLRVNRKKERAHRLSWSLHYGEIPSDLCVLHHCDNPPCVNPRHLFLGTRGDNNRDAASKGRMRNTPRYGEDHHDSKLTNEEVLQMRVEYRENKEPYKVIAKRHNVHPTTVGKIIRKERWKHLPDKEDAE